jgi:hypothetical protein
MATYKEINGTAVQNVAGDPSNPVEGEVWYNSSTGAFRLSKGPVVNAWATGGDLNTARLDLAGTGADSTSALAFGGETSPGPVTADTESYNGTSWTEVNDLNTARDRVGGAGNQTAALAFGGETTPKLSVTESWDGTSWTEVNDLNTARGFLAGAGTQTAALGFGGDIPPNTGATESWNGTSWTEVNDLNTARYALGGVGTQTAALAFGGSAPPAQAG